MAALQQTTMQSGTQLGPYRVEALLGAGGMGEVYLGVDTRLDRQVAIKILAGSLAKDPALRERFEREARTISSLSHPNICTLFDLGRHEGGDYLVMEYLQGETLADRLARGPLPAEQVLRTGAAIASALEAAHRQGIVHRDLKPGNVMLTRSGVKLLDFGLAKLSISSSSANDATAVMATEQKPLTEQGAILGTFQYMAPEQLEGQTVDARTDIFALGVLLYEMATGRRAFQGATKASLIAAILEREPQPMSEVQPLTPPALERVVRACMAKDPDERIQTAHDVALQLKWISESSSVSEPLQVRRRKAIAPWLAAAALAIVAAGAGALLWRERARGETPYTLSVVAPRGYDPVGAALSPDGRFIALNLMHQDTRERSLWLRRLDDGSMKELVPKLAWTPFWSPDSKWIGFRQQPDRLMRVAVTGGLPELICTTAIQSIPDWSDEGTILIAPAFGLGLSKVPASGGEPQPVTKLDASRGESIHASPHFLPGGRRFLYVSHTTAEKRNEIWAGSLDGNAPVRVLAADALAGYSEPYLLFIRDGAAYAQRFDPEDLRLSGDPVRVVDNVAFSEPDVSAGVSLSRSGVLGYVSYQSARIRLNVYERNGSVAATLWEDDDIEQPDLSPDGSTLLVAKFDRSKGARDIHAVDLGRKVSTRVTTGLASNMAPVLSPDGTTVVFHSDRIGMYDIYVQPVDGSTPPRLLWKDGADKFLGDWSADGRHLLVGRFDPRTKIDLWLVTVDGSEKPRPWLVTENREDDAAFSPDGRWVAYIQSAEGETDVYLRGFPNGKSVRVSTEGAGSVAWSPDGREIVWPNRGRIMKVDVDLSGTSPKIGTPRELFRISEVWSRPFVLADGRIAILTPAPGEQTGVPIHVTTAWKAKAAAGQ